MTAGHYDPCDEWGHVDPADVLTEQELVDYYDHRRRIVPPRPMAHRDHWRLDPPDRDETADEQAEVDNQRRTA